MRLLLSMGLNGYGAVYRQNIQSHERYAKRFNYDYWLMDNPVYTPLEGESSWLKLPVIWSALESGYDWVCYVDSDVFIQEDAPDFTSLEQPGKFLYMANGFSERLNGGVIIARNHATSRAWFENLLENIRVEIPSEDDVGWGENGHIIHFARHYEGLCTIPPEWNNNRDPAMTDHFRHFSAGIMRPFYRRTARETISNVYRTILLKAMRRVYRRAGKFDLPRFVSLYEKIIARNRKIERLDLAAVLLKNEQVPAA
jgi:hypothetical protein